MARNGQELFECFLHPHPESPCSQNTPPNIYKSFSSFSPTRHPSFSSSCFLRSPQLSLSSHAELLTIRNAFDHSVCTHFLPPVIASSRCSVRCHSCANKKTPYHVWHISQHRSVSLIIDEYYIDPIMTMEARARPHCPSTLAQASEVPCLSFPEKHHVLLVVVGNNMSLTP